MVRRPNLSKSNLISFDIETFDPNLLRLGPGVYRNDGKILGVAIADDNGFSEYYNIGHKGICIEERKANIGYLKDVFKLDCDKLAANGLYDLDWLINGYGFEINGDYHDIQIAEPLLDEYKKSYSLDNLAQEYLGKQKFKTEIEKFCSQNDLRGDPRAHLYRMPYELVRKYAIEDVLLPIEIFKVQKKKLIQEDLLNIYNLEMSLFPLLLKMRKVGVNIDTIQLEESKTKLHEEIKEFKSSLYREYGEFNYNSSKQIAKIFDKLNISYNETEKGNPNLSKEELYKIEHPFAEKILAIRHKEKILGTFLENSFTKHRIGKRIHCSFFPMRNDFYGTKSGRFSSANPNLQQIPANKKDFLSILCRQLFVPEEHCFWGKIDYSQIEYRLIAHYAAGKKAEHIRKEYRDNPNTDYHALIMEWTNTERKIAKNLNFGMAYAMGPLTCSKKFGWTLDKSKELIQRYHEMVPFVRTTLNNVGSVAKGRGYIKTILNRKARFSDKMREEKKEYQMFNRLIQGSAADLMKKAMSDCYKAGIFNTLIPHLTVHDELDVSIPKTKEGMEAFCEMKNLMEKAVPLRVPVIADAEIGNNWADCSEEFFKEKKKEFIV